MPGSIPFVLGPTASGKSALALRWAERHDAEIISADSRQIYRFMDIGTAKPSAADLERVRHHLVDERDPDESLTAAQFAQEAEQRIGSVLDAGKRVIVAGGSTLYLHALTHGFSPVPDVPDAVRLQLMEELAAGGLPPLVEELQRDDPVLAAKTDLSNPRRVLRALEVYRHTGHPLSSFQGKPHPPRYRYVCVYLSPPRDELYRQIDRRVDQMMDGGLLTEVQRLVGMGYTADLQPMRSIGYAELIRYLGGEMTLDEAVSAIKTNTRRYAKRQMTYFNKYFREAVRLDPARTALDDAAIDQIFERGSASRTD